MSQANNDNTNNDQKKNWKRWKKIKSAKKQNQETNIALVNSNTFHQMTQDPVDANTNKKIRSELDHKGYQSSARVA